MDGGEFGSPLCKKMFYLERYPLVASPRDSCFALLNSWSIVITCSFFSRIRTVIKRPLATPTIPCYLDSFKWHFNYVDYNTVSYLSHLPCELKAHLLFAQHRCVIVPPAEESGGQRQGWGTQLDSRKVAECETLCKTCTFCIDASSVWDLTAICMSLERTATSSSTALQYVLKTKVWLGQSVFEPT